MMDIRPRATGANLSVDVDVVLDSRLLPRVNLTIGAASATQPRVDLILFDREGMTVRCIFGTPTAGADLRNHLGVAPTPPNCEVVGWVLVRPGATAIGTDDIWTPHLERRMTDLERRVRASAGSAT